MQTTTIWVLNDLSVTISDCYLSRAGWQNKYSSFEFVLTKNNVRSLIGTAKRWPWSLNRGIR